MFPFRKLAVCSVAVGLVCSMVAGCAENESSMFVIGVADTTDNDCMLSPSPEGPFIALGRLDTSIRTSYIAGLVVGNQLTERGSRNQLRTETSRVRLEGADIILETAAGGEVAEFSTIGTGFVHPASGTDPNYGAMYAEIIPANLAVGDGDYVARIKVFGTTLGGQEITSGELRFPISVCFGCLINYPSASLDSTVAGGADYLCATSASGAVGMGDDEGTGGCVVGQDRPVNCLACSADYDICRDPSQNPYGG